MSKLALLSILTKSQQSLEESIAAREKEMQKNLRDIEMKETLLRNTNILDLLADDLEFFKNVQQKFFSEKEKRIG